MAQIGYVTELEYKTYAAARGVNIPDGKGAVELTKAMDWLELQNWAGSPTDPEQPFAFPRDGDEFVPARIAQAQMAAALVYHEGGDPMAPFAPRVTSESVGGGAVAVTYSDRGPLVPIYRNLQALIQPFLGTMGGASNFRLTRG